jgi:hypothetical protein
MLVTLDVLKAQLGGIQTKLDFRTVEPFVKNTERRFRQEIGEALYAWLAEMTTPADGDESDLLDLARGVVAWRAYDLALPHLKIRVGDLGLMKAQPSGTVAVTKWEYVDTREATLAMADACLEEFHGLLDRMEPAAWTGSDEFKARQRQYFRSAGELARYAPLVGRNARLFAQLLTYVERAEELYLLPLVTEGVDDLLKDKLENRQPLTTAEAAVLERIRKALAPLALFEAYPYLPLQMDEKGLAESRSKDGVREELKAGEGQMNAQRRALYNDGQLYLARLRRYLDQVASATVFASYFAANQTTDDEPGGAPPDDFTDKPHVVL